MYRLVGLIMTLTVMAESVCYFGPDPNCYYPCRCNDAPVGAYTGGMCDSQTGRCTSGCMVRLYETSSLIQYWNHNSRAGCIEGWNLAEGKPATQSNGSPTEAVKALDYYDDRDEPGSGRFCTSLHSGQPHVEAWWRVDLGSTHHITLVYVYGTYDTIEAKFFETIEVWQSQGLELTGYNYRECAQSISAYRQPGGYSGHNCDSDNIRHLMVKKAAGVVQSHFTLCEVRVMGWKYYNIGTDCSKCINTNKCSIWGFCNNCNTGMYGPKCEGLNTITASFAITGSALDNGLTNKASLLYQEMKAKLSIWLGRTCSDEGNGCYNKLTDVTFSPGSIQADYTMEVLESQSDHSVLLTIYAMIDNGTFTGNDTAYVINGTSFTVANISPATLFKRTSGSVRVTADTYYGKDDTKWQGLISAWFDYYCRADRIIPTIFCEIVTTSLNYKERSVSLNFTMTLSTSIDDELFFRTWKDAVHNGEFADRSYTFDHLSFGNYFDHCESSPCHFGGTCLYNVNSNSCLCLPGFTGLSCETNVNECLSHPCLFGSTCVDEVNGYSCRCAPGYNGTHCETDVNECLSHPCLFGSTCVDEVNGYSCRCAPGYTGTHCETDVNECLSYPCWFGSTCVDEVNGYSCRCAPGYTGIHCETDLNECTSMPCSLTQTCVDEVNRYNCVCSPGYTGSQCEQDINGCLSYPCLFGSTSVDEVNGYSCRCAPGYTGTHCETDVNECLSYPCLFASTCVDEVNGYSCRCAPGYTGTHCETDVNECLSYPCLFGSTCVDEVNGYSCRCAPCYTGTHCETDVNECLRYPCLFGSTCVDEVNGYSCRCAPGYTGTHCETDLNECTSMPCSLTQTCVDEVNRYNCVCSPGYTGSQCEQDVNECLSYPCLFGSTCVDEVNGYSCRCAAGYTGTHCETVKLKSYFPTFGPVAGGTNVTLLGSFMDIDQLNFTLQMEDSTPALNESLVCSTVSWNNTHALMTIPKVDDSYGGMKYNILMTYTDVQGVIYTINSGMVFEYKPNPVIVGIYPRQTFISGGIKLTAVGTNLDSVSDPIMTIIVEQRIYENPNIYIVEKTTTYISENTTVMNSISIIATTPEIPQSAIIEPQNTTYQRQQNVAFIGFNLDGVTRYNNLSQEIGDKGMIKLFALPHVQGFGEDALMFNSKTDTYIEIKGEKFTLGASIVDYTVTIGDGLCRIQSPLLDSAVRCKPPESEPNAVVVDRREYREGHPIVLMYIGNAKFYIGYIDYLGGRSTLVYLFPSVIVFIVIIIAIIGIVFLCKRNQSSNNNQPNDSPRTGAHSAMPTNITSDYMTLELTHSSRFSDGYLTPLNQSNTQNTGIYSEIEEIELQETLLK